MPKGITKHLECHGIHRSQGSHKKEVALWMLPGSVKKQDRQAQTSLAGK